MANQGVDAVDLIQKSKDEIRMILIANHRDANNADTVRQFGDHLEQRRKAKLEILLKVRISSYVFYFI